MSPPPSYELQVEQDPHLPISHHRTSHRLHQHQGTPLKASCFFTRLKRIGSNIIFVLISQPRGSRHTCSSYLTHLKVVLFCGIEQHQRWLLNAMIH